MTMTEGRETSFLASPMLMYIYYFLGILAVFVGGFPMLIVFVGGIVSRMAARREDAPLIVAHSSWIVRSTWVSTLLMVAVCLGGIILLLMSGVDFDALPDDIDVQAIMNNPALQQSMAYVMGMMCGVFVVMAWFFYRMVRGAYKLSRALPPVS